MKTLLTFLKSSVLAAILAILVLVSGYFFLKEYGAYLTQTTKLETLTMRLGISRNQLQETTRKQRIAARTQSFLNQTNSLGLQEKRWATYNVSIEEPITFDAFEQILDQCNHTSLFYFNPISLQINTNMDPEKAIKTNNPPKRSVPGEEKDGDISIDLKGAFIVRETL